MRTIRAFVKSRLLLSYYALVFAISWGGALLVTGGPNAIPGTEEQFERLLPFAILALLAIGEEGEHLFAWQRQAHGRLEDVLGHASYCIRRCCPVYGLPVSGLYATLLAFLSGLCLAAAA
jgi:hypothetical protein